MRNEYLLAEGPVFDERTSTLYFVDILAHKLIIKKEEDFEEILFPTFVSSVHLTEKENLLLITLRSEVLLFNTSTKESKLVCKVPLAEGVRFNDGRVGPDGALYMGTMKIEEPREKEGRLYRITAEGYTKFPFEYCIPNGVVFHEGNMYQVESAEDKIRVFKVGSELEEQPPIYLEKGSCPDGMCLSVKQLLYVALWNKGEIAVLDITTGKEVERLRGFKTSLSCTALSSSGQLFITCGEDEHGPGRLYEIKVQDKKRGDCLWKIEK